MRLSLIRTTMTMLVGMLAAAASAGAVTITEFEVEPGAAPGVHAPRYIDVGPDQNLWFTDGGTRPGIGRVSPAGERFAQIPTVFAPMDLAVTRDGSGTIYFSGDGGLLRRTSNGTVSDARRAPSYGLALDAAGVLRWAEARLGDETSYCYFNSPEWGGTTICIYPTGAAGTHVTGMTLGPDGRVWGAWYEWNKVRQSVASGGSTRSTFDLPVGSGPSRIAAGPDGNVWVTMYDASAIDRFTTDGIRTRFPLQPGRKPNDIVAGPDGALWFTEYGVNRIGRMTTAGDVTEFDLPTPGSNPIGITAGPDGAIWFTATGSGRIGRLVLDPVTPPGGGGGGGGGTPGGGTPGGGTPGGGTPGGGGGGTPPPGGGTPAPPAADVTPPSFTRSPAFAPARFTVTARRRGLRRGSTLTLALSEPATLSVTVARPAAGRRVRGRCVAPGRRNRSAARCTRLLGARTFRQTAAAGPVAIAFSGRIAGRALAAGSYRATVTATDAAGLVSRTATVTFTVAG